MDGNAKTDVSNRREPGMFCGEAEQPQTFISETSYVKILFHADNFTDQVQLIQMCILLSLHECECVHVHSVCFCFSCVIEFFVLRKNFHICVITFRDADVLPDVTV